MRKAALVTGASRGIGRAIAWELAREGWCVGINYHTHGREAEELAAAIREIRDRMLENLALGAAMSCSGSAVFGVYGPKSKAKR